MKHAQTRQVVSKLDTPGNLTETSAAPQPPRPSIETPCHLKQQCLRRRPADRGIEDTMVEHLLSRGYCNTYSMILCLGSGLLLISSGAYLTPSTRPRQDQTQSATWHTKEVQDSAFCTCRRKKPRMFARELGNCFGKRS